MEYLIIIGAFFSIGHLLMALKSNSDFRKAVKTCNDITSKLKG